MSSQAASSSRESSEEPEIGPAAVKIASVEATAVEENLLSRTAPVFRAPSGYKKASYNEDAASQFDFDDIATKDFELWLLRVPSTLKTKHIEGLAIPEPGSSTSFKARKQRYELGDAKIRGDMDSMTALLPRKSKDNQLYKSSKPFARKLAVTPADDADGQVVNIEEAPLSMADQHKQPQFTYCYEATGSSAAQTTAAIDERPKKKRKK